MTRKEALIQILTLLVNHWDLAKDFLLLLQKSNDEQLVEKIYSFLKKEIKKLKGTQQGEKIRQSLAGEFSHREIEEQDKKEADELLTLLE